MITPSLAEVLAHAGDETHIALTLELSADTETPISLYAKLSGGRRPSFLLESVEGGEALRRYSFVGFDVDHLVECGSDPLVAVEAELSRYSVAAREGIPRFLGGVVGYMGFDAVAAFERVPLAAGAGPGVPVARFMLATDVAIFDHLKQRIILVTHMPLAGDRRWAYRASEKRFESLIERLRGAPPAARTLIPEAKLVPLPARSNVGRAAYLDAVRAAREAIAAGEVFQVVLSQRFTVEAEAAPFELYRALRGLNPSPYMFLLDYGDLALVGASPEVLVRLDGREVLVRPIAGTRRRGRDRREDEALERELLADEKELAEHRMLVDLGRNDVGRVAELGSVEVQDALHVERYSHVMHIVSDVVGRARDEVSAFDVLRACFPAGTLSGAPKIRAMELIARLEPERRGIYGGAVGYFDFHGNMDTCIAIRTMLVEGGRVHVQAGAGVVFDSDPEREHEECENKARSCLLAIAEALGARPA